MARSSIPVPLGGFTCAGKDLNFQFHEDKSFRPFVESIGQGAVREYEQLDPAKDCLIIFDQACPMTVDDENRQVRVIAKALLIKKSRGIKYKAIH